MTLPIRDRARGALVGLAVGDAVGTAVEFKERGEFTPLTDMVGGGAFRLAPGEWTDDTSMALCLADSLIECGELDASDLLLRFSRWYRSGYNSHNGRCFDIGATCSGAIAMFENQSQLAAPDMHWAAGNGSIMRLAPSVIYWHDDEEKAVQCAIAQGATTHGAQTCHQSCEELGRMLVRLINDPEADVVADVDALKEIKSHDLNNSGWVVSTLAAAKWAFVTTDNFRDCILAAANLGGDADTIAAVAGQLAGAKYGMSGIPSDWVEKLAWREHITWVADQLLDAGHAE